MNRSVNNIPAHIKYYRSTLDDLAVKLPTHDIKLIATSKLEEMPVCVYGCILVLPSNVY